MLTELQLTLSNSEICARIHVSKAEGQNVQNGLHMLADCLSHTETLQLLKSERKRTALT